MLIVEIACYDARYEPCIIPLYVNVFEEVDTEYMNPPHEFGHTEDSLSKDNALFAGDVL